MITMSKANNKIVVQTANVLVEEKEKAEAYAISQGFDSLQAALRFVIRKMANQRIKFDLQENLVPVGIEEKIGRGIEDFEQGRFHEYQGDLGELLEKE
jgi:hypothetical protein